MVIIHRRFLQYTPLKFNITPENWWLEDYFPIGKVTLEGYVKLREGILKDKLER